MCRWYVTVNATRTVTIDENFRRRWTEQIGGSSNYCSEKLDMEKLL